MYQLHQTQHQVEKSGLASARMIQSPERGDT